MIRFNCDYGEGAHPAILKRMMETNMVQTPGYGEDEFCREAADMIREACRAPEAAVHFLVGGTQTNLTVIDAALRPYQGVVSASTGHINVHETGAVEACGHKVLAIESDDGLLDPDRVEELCRLHFADEAHEHIVMPGAVYISHPTELGTLYSRAQIEALRKVCDAYHMILFLDGARLGYGLSASSDVDLPFLAKTCDAFYIGGTKQGALFGEAVVISNPELNRNFRYLIKQHGGMLAKGRLLGIQFAELFRDGLYFELSDHAIACAMKLKKAFAEKGYPFFVDSPTNQQFPVLPDAHLDVLRQKYSFSYQARVDEAHSAVRFCTSWATREADVDALIADIRALEKSDMQVSK
ncbi:MAG: low specificity L-threonine aldolase [Clostridia bacterium]|nr:low specificity L-threonine aldolase [Clostridia bacterium]